MDAIAEIFTWAAFTTFASFWFAKKKKIFSAVMMFTTAVSLLYFGFAASFGGNINLTTMPWPVAAESLIPSIRVTIYWVFFFVSAYSIAGSVVPLGRFKQESLFMFRDSKTNSRKVDKRIFFLTLWLGVIILGLSTEGWWIFQPYPGNKSIWRVVDLGGLSFISLLLFLTSIFLGFALKGVYKYSAFIISALLATHIFLTGQRSSLLFWCLSVFFVIYYYFPKSIRWRIKLLGLILSVPFLYVLDALSTWRSWGVDYAKADLLEEFSEIDLLPQALAHLYYSFQLTNFYGPQFSSMLDFFIVFFVQILPVFLLSKFNWDFYHGAWVLGEYVNHGGGFFVPAEMYFVGGMMGLIFLSSYFAVLSLFLDRILVLVIVNGFVSLRNPIVLSAVLATASLPYNLFYGIQSIHRMMTLPFLVWFLLWLWRSARGRHRPRSYNSPHWPPNA